MTTWRVGRTLGRTIYEQAGDEPSKSDVLVGMVETRELAAHVVNLHNWAPPVTPGLEEEIRQVINRASAENSSNTPDYLLAGFLVACLDAFNLTVRRRDIWYGVQLAPGRDLQGPAAGGDLG